MPIDSFLTHIPILAKCILKFGGNVLEFGTGIGSSPLLCSLVEGELCSFESNRSWYNSMISGIHGKNLWKNKNHNIYFVENNNWDSVYNIIDKNKNWSIAFIDHAPGERRTTDIIKLKNKVDVILYHDSEEPSYGWDILNGHFKFSFSYDVFKTETTVVSNKYDVNLLLNNI